MLQQLVGQQLAPPAVAGSTLAAAVLCRLVLDAGGWLLPALDNGQPASARLPELLPGAGSAAGGAR